MDFGADNEIKLDPPEPICFGDFDGMFAKRSSGPLAAEAWMHHIAAVCNVRTESHLVGFDEISAGNPSVFFCYDKDGG